MLEEYWLCILILNFIFGLIIGVLIPIWKEPNENWKYYLCSSFSFWILSGIIYFSIVDGINISSEFVIHFVEGLFVGYISIFIFEKVSK